MLDIQLRTVLKFHKMISLRRQDPVTSHELKLMAIVIMSERDSAVQRKLWGGDIPMKSVLPRAIHQMTTLLLVFHMRIYWNKGHIERDLSPAVLLYSQVSQ